MRKEKDIDVKLAKKYQKFKDKFLDYYKSERDFEQYGFNYIAIGHFFDILNELEKYRFDISNKKVKLNAFPDNDCNTFGIEIFIESGNSDDKIRGISVEVGTWCNQYFGGKITNKEAETVDDETLDREWSEPARYEYEINDPFERFCCISIYGEKFNGDDVDVEYYFDRKDMPKIVKWLKNCLESTSPDETINELEKI